MEEKGRRGEEWEEKGEGGEEGEEKGVVFWVHLINNFLRTLKSPAFCVTE